MIQIKIDRCTGCSMCVPACPNGSISCLGVADVNDDCLECLECIDFCPNNALMQITPNKGPDNEKRNM